MALRTFTDRDGVTWNVWNVAPNANMAGYQERYREGWVCFEQTGGSGRCRIPLSEVPPGWDLLPDERLDLIRRIASTSSTSGSGAMHRSPENDANASPSGPHHTVGADGEAAPGNEGMDRSKEID